VILHRIILFAHVLFAFLYFLVHGASVAVAYRVRRETSAERVRALLDLSWSTVVTGYYLLMATIVCGVALGFMGHWWSAWWIWVSIAVLVVVLVAMLGKIAPYFHAMRRAAGLAFVDGRWEREAEEGSPDDLARAIASAHPVAITAVGVAGWAVILWLMLFKPF
jgi:hypothetical protein